MNDDEPEDYPDDRVSSVVYEVSEPLFAPGLIEKARERTGVEVTVDQMLHHPALIGRRLLSLAREEQVVSALLPRPKLTRRQRITYRLLSRRDDIRERAARKIAPWLTDDRED